MATLGGIFVPDYDGSVATVPGGFNAWVGSLAQNAVSGPIFLGKYRVWKLTFQPATAGANSAILRFTLGLSNSSQHAAISPTVSSPFLHNYHENFFELNGGQDSINLANIDNSTAVILYTVLPVSKF